MHLAEARLLLGFPPNSHPCPTEVKAAYRKKVWDYHPDRFPAYDQKAQAESKFKSITEAYSCLVSGRDTRSTSASAAAAYGRVRTSGVPASYGGGGRKNRFVMSFPFMMIIFGTIGLGGFHASRAYRKQKHINPMRNPFLP